jgi:hypothetical protein
MVPPVAVTVAVPLLPLLQLTFVCELMEAETPGDMATVTLAVLVHPF